MVVIAVLSDETFDRCKTISTVVLAKLANGSVNSANSRNKVRNGCSQLKAWIPCLYKLRRGRVLEPGRSAQASYEADCKDGGRAIRALPLNLRYTLLLISRYMAPLAPW